MNKKNKALTALLTLGLTSGLAGVPVFAEDNENPVPETAAEGIELSKSATLEEDGTYTLNLEAYATGEVKTTTKTDELGVPCDIVLVLDESGSMKDPINNNNYISAGTSFSYNDLEDQTYYFFYNNKYYKVSRETRGWRNDKYGLTFSEGRNKYSISTDGSVTRIGDYETTNFVTDPNTKFNIELFQLKTKTAVLKEAVDQFITNVSADAAKNGADHKVALVGFAGSNNNNNGSRTIVSLQPVNDENKQLNSAFRSWSLNFNGGTWAEYGLKDANSILSDRQEKTFTNLKGEQQARKQIVIFFTDGIPGDGHTSSSSFSDSANKSANASIAQANALKQSGATVYSVAVLEGADPNGDYLNYSNLNAQKNAFLHLVSSNYDYKNPAPTMNTAKYGTAKDRDGYYVVASDEESLKNIFEVLSQNVSSSTSTSKTTLTSAAVLKDIISDEFDLPAGEDKVKAYTVDYAGKDGSGNLTWKEFSKQEIAATVDQNSKSVSVTGFDYSSNYVVDGSNNLPTSGKKVVLEIKGVTANDLAVTGDKVYTNAPTSGVYKDSSADKAVALFPRPETILTKKAYVMDYAASKNVNSSDWKQNSLRTLNNDMKGSTNTLPSLTYGTVAVNNENNTVTYNPRTTSWNGYDSVYAFGTSEDEEVRNINTNGNLWSKVSFIPAHNVYFEDDFTTTSDGKVGIVYTGEWKVVNDDVEHADISQTDGNSDIHGWIEEISGNTGFTGGSAHGSGTKNATAEFTFTGDGLDIYSRTNADTGKVNIKIYNADGSLISGRTVDHVAQHGDYYHLPTYRWKGEYGTYMIKIQVRADAKAGVDYNYYLDGIRVYNPLGNNLDETVKDAYGDEVNAQFVTVRDEILRSKENSLEDSDTPEPAAYYIDSLNGTTTDLAVYEEHGPKSEVYIAPGHSLVIPVEDTSAKYAIGMKTPIGTAQAAVTLNGDKKALQINSATDMFYEVTPNADGNIIIENTNKEGDSFLSITKLKKTNSVSTTMYAARSANQAMASAANFANLNVLEYNGEVTDSNIESAEGPTDAVEAAPETEENNVDVVISESSEEAGNSVKKSFFETVFGGFRSIFGFR